MKKLLGCMVFAVVACGGSKATTTTTANVAANASGGIALKELSFYEGNDLGMKLHADGMVEVKGKHSASGQPTTETWQHIAQLTTDGKVLHDGVVGGQLKADGTFEMSNGKPAAFHIEGAALVIGDKKVTIDDKGQLQGGNADAKPMRVDGVTDDASRRTALLMLGLMFGAEEHDEHSEAVPVTNK
jgi:hypothetical protein